MRIFLLLVLVVPLVASAAERRGGPATHCDLLIAGARVVDGTGAPWFSADVCVAGDRIAQVGRSERVSVGRRIDAAGMVVTPGFIDMLGQSEFYLLADNRVASKITQGITTEITGESGYLSAAHDNARRMSPFKGLYDDWGIPDWADLEGYFRVFEAEGATLNLGTFISASGVREVVMGREDRAASADELERMSAHVAAAMESGALGLSTALQYVPDRFASTEELIALARVSARYGGIYATHQRSEADRIDESLDEVFRIAREARIPAHIHHLKTAYIQNWGRMPAVLARLERAREEGLDVTADHYPYTGGANFLDANLPAWARAGGRSELLARLADPATRERIKAELLTPDPTWENQYLGAGGGAGILVAAVYRPDQEKFAGKTLEQIGQEEGKDPVDVLLDLVAADGTVPLGINFVMREDDVRAALRHRLVSMCTDFPAVAGDGVLGKVGSHPRAWGTAARILGKYVREEKLLSLEEAVRKMTSLPASRVGLADRGVLRPGMAADIVVFDPDTVIDRATFADPRQYSEGIPYVIVNGQLVVDGGEITDARPGRILRGPGYRAGE